jgi:hypothetical protein
VVEQLKSSEPEPKRRRSTRIVQAIPLTISGEDALGQPFKERTSTLIVSCHGCRYQSRHYVPRNGWVELEVPHPDAGHEPRRVRARVSWIQRPRTVRELFQVGVEFELPGNIWGVSFPPDDWFPWQDQAGTTLPSPRLATAGSPETGVVEDTLPLEAPQAAGGEKVRTMPRPGAPAEPADAASRQVNKLVADARRQIQEDVKKIVSSVVTAESGQIMASLSGQLRGAATEAVKQALMHHGQIHAERLDVALREAQARLEIGRYEAARFVKEQAEAESKTILDAVRQTQPAAQQAVEQALARLENAREETARALSMQSRAEAQRIMAQTAARMEDLLRQSLGRIEEAGRAGSEHLTEVARADMEKSVAGALEGLRAEIAGTSEELRKLAALELESGRGRLEQLRNEIAAATQTAATESLGQLETRLEATREQVAGLAREAGELETAIAQKIATSRGAWQGQIESDLEGVRGRWEETVSHSLTATTETLRARLEEAAQTAMAPAIASLQQQIEAQTAGAREALESLQAEAGHAVTGMRAAAAETTAQTDHAATAAQEAMGQLQATLDTRTEETRQIVEGLRQTLEGESQRMQALLNEVRQGSERIEAALRELESLRQGAGEEIRRELEEQIRTQSTELAGRAGRAWEEFSAKIAPAFEAAEKASLEKLGRAMDEEVTGRLSPELERVKEALAQLGEGQERAEEAFLAFRERLHEAVEQGARDSVLRLETTVAQVERDFQESSRQALARILAEIDEKSTEATHTTFESLLKASEWYQKKAQTSMQTALDRALEQVVASLREKAGEMSRMFASEVDHFSRSYTEHTRGLLEEAARKAEETTRDKIEMAADAATTHVTQESRRITEHQLARTQRAGAQAADETIARIIEQAQETEIQAGQTAAEVSQQIEDRAAIVREGMLALHTESVTAFGQRLAAEISEGLTRAQRELEMSLQPILQCWRDEREQLQREWAQNLGELGRRALDEQRDHLGNVANSMLVTTVASLSERSQNVLDQVAQAAEQRMRESCARVFAGLGEALRQRLLGLSGEIAPKQDGPAAPPTGE